MVEAGGTKPKLQRETQKVSGFLTSCSWLFYTLEEFLHLCTASTNGNQSAFRNTLFLCSVLIERYEQSKVKGVNEANEGCGRVRHLQRGQPQLVIWCINYA